MEKNRFFSRFYFSSTVKIVDNFSNEETFDINRRDSGRLWLFKPIYVQVGIGTNFFPSESAW
jgi:hypothetical protein